MIPIVKEIIVYSRYDFFFFVLVFPFGLLIQVVMAMVDNGNNNCFKVEGVRNMVAPGDAWEGK